MKIIAASDPHGYCHRLRQLEAMHQDADYFLCAGDFSDPQFDVSPWISVKGNNDRTSLLPEEQLIETPKGNILLIHGHQYPVRNRLEKLAGKAKILNAQIVVFGHTHTPLTEQKDDLLIVNPGSLYRSRSPLGLTYAVIEWDEKPQASIERFEPDPSGSGKRKGKQNQTA